MADGPVVNHWLRSRSGHVKVGGPAGTSPSTATPWSSRCARTVTTVATTSTMSAHGALPAMRRPPTSTTTAAAASRSEQERDQAELRQARHEVTQLLEELSPAVDLDAEHLGDLAHEDVQGETTDDENRLRQEVGVESQLQEPEGDEEDTADDRLRQGEGHVGLASGCGEPGHFCERLRPRRSAWSDPAAPCRHRRPPASARIIGRRTPAHVPFYRHSLCEGPPARGE